MKKDLSIKISIDTETGKVKVLNQELKNLNSNINKTSKSTFDFSDALKAVGTVIAGLGIYELTKQVIELSKSFVETAAKFEQFSVALKSIEGNSKVAQKSMEWIQDFAAKTPYQLDQVTEGFIKLRAYGLNAQKDLVWLGDTASAMGKPLMQAVEAIADAVNGEFERLKEFGVKGYQQGNKAALQWTTRSGEVKNIVIENNSKIIESTLKAIWNSKYAGAMKEQSKTWNGLLSTMQGNWEIFKNNIMKAGLFDYLKSILLVINDYLNKAFKNGSKAGQDWAKNIINATKGVIESIGGIIDSFNFLKRVMLSIKLIWLVFKEGVLSGAAAIENAILGMYNKMVEIHNLIPGLDEWEKASKSSYIYTEALQKNTKEIRETINEITKLGAESENATKFAKKFLGDVEKKLKLITTTTKDTKTNIKTLDKEMQKILNKAQNGSFKGFSASETNKAKKELQKIADKQKSLMKYLQSEYNSFLPKKEQIGIWYNEMKAKIKELYKNNSDEMKKALGLLDEVTINKIREANKNNNTDDNSKNNTDFSNVIEPLLNKIGISLNEKQKNSIDKIADVIKKSLSLLTKTLKAVFNEFYDSIKSKYRDSIDNYQQNTYTNKLKSNAYSAFDLAGNAKVASYNASISNIKMLEEQNKMYYELSKRAKTYKQTIQTSLEVAGVAWSAAGAATGMGINSVSQAIDGLNLAINAQNIADNMTNFKDFQQAYIDGIKQFKQAIRDLADEMISVAGDIYKSIDDYRNIYDKITDTNTYEMQKYAESIAYIGKYTDLTSDSLASFTTAILKADKSFVEGAVDSASNVNKILNNDLFKKYGLAIDSLNEKFKDSLSIVADLIDKQREANDSIRDYVSELRGITDRNYNLEYTQQQYAQAKQDYLAGKIDSNELLDKAKSFQNAAGNNDDLVNLLANSLESVTEQSTEDYLEGILKNTANLSVVGLPNTNIEALTAPEADTLDAIKDTNSFLQKIIRILKNPSKLFENVVSILKEILEAIKNIAGAVWNFFRNGFNSVLNWTESFFTNLANTVSRIFKGIFNGLGNLLNGAWGWTKRSIANVYKWTKDNTAKAYKWTKNSISNVYKWTKDSITKTVSTLKTWVKNLINSSIKSVSKSATNLTKGISKSGTSILKHFHFATGGYTGNGLGYKDKTGEPVAGIVHAGEWVAPRWMVNSYSNLFASLENIRLNKTFPKYANGGFVSVNIPKISANNINVAVNIAEIQQTNFILQEQLALHKKMYRLMLKFDEEGIRCIS